MNVKMPFVMSTGTQHIAAEQDYTVKCVLLIILFIHTAHVNIFGCSRIKVPHHVRAINVLD